MKDFKKILFVLLAVLFALSGAAMAANIPDAGSPQDQGEKWIMSVYNNSSNTINKGDIVIWDIDSSTGDAFMWINSTATANTGPVAGIANQNILGKSDGSIVIYGLTTANYWANGTVPNVNSKIVTAAAAGQCDVNNNATTNILGKAVAAGSSGTVKVFVNPQP